MKPQNPQEHTAVQKQHKTRSLGLSVLLIFSFVYNGILLIAMVFGIFAKEIVLDILQQYYKQILVPANFAMYLTLVGTLIFTISIFGLILLWMMRKRGFYFYASAQAILLASIIFIFKSFDLVNISIAIAIIIIIGLHTKAMR